MRLKNNTILVQISEKDRDKIFRQEIKLADGSNMFISKEIEAQFGEDKFFSQTVGLAKVLQVADDVINIIPGDLVIIQNTVDSNPKIVIEEGEGYKNVVIQANHTYHDDDYYTPPTGEKRGGWVWRKGDLDRASFITVLVRDGNFISINKIIVVRHENTPNDPIISGINVLSSKRKVIATRKILSAPNDTDYSHGDIVAVDNEIIGMFDMGGKLFEYFDVDDVILHKRMNKK